MLGGRHGCPCPRIFHPSASRHPCWQCSRSDELLSYDPYDEGTFCRSRFWLLMAYGISLAAIGSSVLVMLHKGGDVAPILQVERAGCLPRPAPCI